MTGDTEHTESGTAPTAGHGPVDRLVGRPVEQRDIVCELERALARLATGEAMTEGELWSWVRSVMCQGADIRCDYELGLHKGYEAYSARLDMAAAERADQMLARLKTPNNQGEPGATKDD